MILFLPFSVNVFYSVYVTFVSISWFLSAYATALVEAENPKEIVPFF